MTVGTVDFDVIVCGGGTAGSVAAIRAARLGLRTAIVERQSQLGGSATAGLVTPVMANSASGVELVAGIHRELHNELSRLGYAELRGFDPVWAAMVLEKFAVDAGAQIIYHCELIGAKVEADRLVAVRAAALGRQFELSASYFVDATGDALLAMMAGEPTREGAESGGKHQPTSLRFVLANVDVERVIKFVADHTPPGERCIWPCKDAPSDEWTLSIHPKWLEQEAAQSDDFQQWKDHLVFSFYTIPGRPETACFNSPRILCKDASDPKELSRSYTDGRQQIQSYWRFFKDRVPGFEKSYIAFVAPLMGIRECRRIVGNFILTEEHVRHFEHFEDSISACSYAIDIHHTQNGGATLWYLPDDKWYEIPYRALLPLKCTNLIVAGRCISSDFVAHSSYRVIPSCRGLGEAAAYACAAAVNNKCRLNQIDAVQLKQQLCRDEIMMLPH